MIWHIESLKARLMFYTFALIMWWSTLHALFGFLCCFGPVYLVLALFAVASPVSVLDSLLLCVTFPWVVVFIFRSWRSRLDQEVILINSVGKDEALWHDLDLFEGKVAFRAVGMQGWDLLSPYIIRVLGDVGLSEVPLEGDLRDGLYKASSRWWSNCVLSIHAVASHRFTPWFYLSFITFSFIIRIPVFIAKKGLALLRFWALGALFIWHMPDELAAKLYTTLVEVSSLFYDGKFVEWVGWQLTRLSVRVTVVLLDAQFIGVKWTTRKGFRSDSEARKFSSVLREGLMQFSIFVTDLGLPHYIRGSREPTRQGVQESYELLKELGWPVNVGLQDPDLSVVPEKWSSWVISGTDWQQGINNMKTHVDHDLDKLRLHAIEYRRTEEYASVENELEATSRYFRSPRYDYPDLALEDVWFMIKDTFVHSRLTPFNHIIRMWEKKYGLGAFFRRPGSKAKMRRSDFISSIGGYAPFKRLWRATFEVATSIVPVSAVSVKNEALPPNKWAENKVRSIIGSPIAHYILSTIWNYEPNHRFAWTTTPTKIGMPLNGYWLADLYHRHSRCQHHVAGDMSAFDSTLSGEVVKMIAAVRKKGFESHKDVDRICDLIDVSYEQLGHQLLNTTSTGNIYGKGTGLTTGHSSTSMDNSLGLLILYLMAWKQLTGLGAREFKHFNELSDYGDDHILSYLSTKPAAWNFRNIQKVMARWGVTNREEKMGSLDVIPFLSKTSRKVTNEDRVSFAKYGVKEPKRVVLHDREKLVGKMVAKVKNLDPVYRAKRLISYMGLTAHHEDLYSGISDVLARSSTLRRAVRKEGLKIPTYKKVLQQWYNPSANISHDVIQEELSDGQKSMVMHYGQVTIIDSISGALAMLPDILNPAIFNFGYSRLLQLQLRSFLEWPIEFLVMQNGVVSQAELLRIFRSTAYEAVDPTIHTMSGASYDYGGLLLRHWLFCWYKGRSLAPSVLSWFEKVVGKVNLVQFLLNGRANIQLGRANPYLLDLFVISILNLVPSVPILSPLKSIRLPRVDIFLDMVWQVLVVFVWSGVPPNYKELTHLARQLQELKGGVLVTAPTGTGKSTTMVKHLELTLGLFYNKIVIIEPRSALVKSLVPYCKNTLNMSCTGRTMGFDFDRREKVWYVTPQEAALHWEETFEENNLIMIDEAHIEEPFYVFLKEVLKSSGRGHLLVTATPTPSLLDSCVAQVPLLLAQLWTVLSSKDSCMESDPRTCIKRYEDWVVDQVHNSWTNSKALVFHPSKDGAARLADRISRKCSFYNSDVQDGSGQVILSTNVTDAGLTLPNVDLVLTSELDNVMDPAAGTVVLGRLSLQTTYQRRGRTGRTSNGQFKLFACPNANVKQIAEIALNEKSLVSEWLSLGLSPWLIHTIDSKRMFSFLGMDSERVDPDLLRETLNSLQLFSNNLEFLRASRAAQEAQKAEDPNKFVYDYSASGIIRDSSTIDFSEISRIALRVAALGPSLKRGMDVDAGQLDSDLFFLDQISGVHTPFKNLMPDLTGLLEKTDYDYKEVQAIKPPKILHKGCREPDEP